MDQSQNDSIELEDTIKDNEFIDPILKESDYNSNPKIISFITEFMSLPLNAKIARFLINKNIRNIRNPITLDTLIHYLCINDENFPLLKLIKPNKKEIEQKNSFGQTLLHVAIQNKSYKIINYLIKNGANLQSLDNKNNTPLHIAVRNGDYNIVKLFMESNPNINILNNNQETPLDIAKKNNDKILINLLDKKDKNNIVGAKTSMDKKINMQRKKDYLNRGNSGDKFYKSNIYNSSVNNCSIETKNETDNPSINIYRKKIVSKDTKYAGERRIKCNKTINLNFNFNYNKNDCTPNKKTSYNAITQFSPIISRTRFVYRKTSPKLINKNDSFNEFSNYSNLVEYDSNLKHISPEALRKDSNISSYSTKKGFNNIIINKPNKIQKNIMEQLKYCQIDKKPKVKIIHYDKLNDTKIEPQKNNYSPISIENIENNNYKIKKVRNTHINNTPFVSFKKHKKKKRDLSKDKLFEFLKEIGMQHYADMLISEGFDDINLILNQMKEGFPILDDSLKEIGVSSPGDRAKILIRMQQMTGGFDFDFPFEQVFFKNNRSIQRWLQKEGMIKYANNFIDAGYQSFELLLIQMASKYKINDKILKNDIFINNEDDRKSILKSLEKNSEKYTYELSRNKNVQRTYSKMVIKNNSDSFCYII